MDEYGHLRVLISLILGLAITRVLSGLSRRLQLPGRTQGMYAQIVWALVLLLSAVHFWWWEFGLRLIHEWHFATYVFLLAYSSLFFLMATLLYPDALQDHQEAEAFFIRRRRGFFLLFALTFVFDLLDTQIKGPARWHDLGRGYPVHVGLGLIVSLLAIRSTANARQLTWLGLFWLACDLVWIILRYDLLD